MEYVLRRYTQDDAEGVKNLILSILAKEYPFDRSAYSDSDLDRIQEVYGKGNECFFVIEDGGAIVGTVGIKEDAKDDALLRRLFVDSRHRKKGYGTSLLKKALEFCREKRFARVYFRCTDRMLDAMNLCKKEGFVETEALEVSGFKIHKLKVDLTA